MIEVGACSSQKVWDGAVLEMGGHPLQLWGWGEVKAAHGWRVNRVFVRRDTEVIGAAQLLIRPLPEPFRALAYVPRGPVCAAKDREAVLEALTGYARRVVRPVALTIEPHWREFRPPKGWRRTENTILIPRTLILDLTKTEDELMAAMRTKRRYDIRRGLIDVPAIREVTDVKDVAKCLVLYKETAKRAGFALHGDDYYRDVFEKLGKHSRLVAAWNQKGEPIAFIWLAVSKQLAFDLYGGSNQEGQQLRANYVLKWWCITHLRKEGVRQYDLNGLLNDGVGAFKRSFADHEDMLAGTYDRPLSPLYGMWQYGLPVVKRIVRFLKR